MISLLLTGMAVTVLCLQKGRVARSEIQVTEYIVINSMIPQPKKH
jgi:hypothetical protein